MVKRAVFLDRDGTINVDNGYLSDPESVELESSAALGLQQIVAYGYTLIVITNQSGIGRGLFTHDAATSVNRRIADLLAREGVTIAAFYVCPHDPKDDCGCRKPRPELVNQAVREHDLDVTASLVIGDKQSDMLLARNVGARGILVTTGDGERHALWAKQNDFYVCGDLAEAAQICGPAGDLGKV